MSLFLLIMSGGIIITISNINTFLTYGSLGLGDQSLQIPTNQYFYQHQHTNKLTCKFNIERSSKRVSYIGLPLGDKCINLVVEGQLGL